MCVATLSVVGHTTVAGNDVGLEVADAQAEAVLSGLASTFQGKVTTGTLAVSTVKYREVEISGWVYEVVEVKAAANGTRATVTLGMRIDTGSAFTP